MQSNEENGPQVGVQNKPAATPAGLLVLGALGVVYGDIGTSPLYALRACFNGATGVAPSRDNVFGVLSLIVWSLALIVSVKYIAFVLRADNRGEGGILTLMTVAFPGQQRRNAGRAARLLTLFALFGASLLYGEGLITPAITVLGAVEGLETATPLFSRYTVPLSLCILMALFSVQRAGAGGLGRVFGWVMLVWFVTIAALGINAISRAPGILASLSPHYALRFFAANGWQAYFVLGGVFLVVTGAEALYADLGHFGRKPIRVAWFGLVLPALLLNYLGQGALLMVHPEAAENPFYRMAPPWALYGLVFLATSAAVIASQALISGSFSLTVQAVRLGYAPRVLINHTSSTQHGQIYVPGINWVFMGVCLGLVLGFRSSGNLAAAYGIAVVCTMLITTCLFFFAARRLWGWSSMKAGAVSLSFLLAELAFLGANLSKVEHGGWFPLAVGAFGFTLMSTWKTGRARLRQRLAHSLVPLTDFLRNVMSDFPKRVKGTAVFLAGNPEGTPLALLHNLKHNKILHERVVLLTVLVEEIPFVEEERRVEVTDLGNSFYRVLAHYGFMEEPQVPEVLKSCRQLGLELSPMTTTFFLSRETIIPSERRGFARWRKHLFATLSRNAQPATAYFGLPPDRVVELGMQIEI